MFTPRPPAWASAHRRVARWPLAGLVEFSPVTRETSSDAAAVTAALPTLFIPPQSGHSSALIDLAPGPSQVSVALEAGLHRPHALRWNPPVAGAHTAGIEDYLDVIGKAVERLGGRAHLVGDSQGGWLALMQAALHPSSVASLTLIGTPTDFDQGPKLLRLAGHPGKAVGLGAARMLVALNQGALPGATAVAGMLAADLPALSKRAANAAFAPTAGNDRGLLRWLIAPQAIPGGLYLWLLEHVVFDNGLVHGSIRVGGRAVELSAIQCPLFLLAGSDDAVAPAGQVFALRHRVSTSKGQTLRLIAQAGHLDLFTAPEVLRGPWLRIIRHIQQLPGG